MYMPAQRTSRISSSSSTKDDYDSRYDCQEAARSAIVLCPITNKKKIINIDSLIKAVMPTFLKVWPDTLLKAPAESEQDLLANICFRNLIFTKFNITTKHLSANDNKAINDHIIAFIMDRIKKRLTISDRKRIVGYKREGENPLSMQGMMGIQKIVKEHSMVVSANFALHVLAAVERDGVIPRIG